MANAQAPARSNTPQGMVGTSFDMLLRGDLSLALGIMAIIACGIMTFIGFIWLRKILQIEV